MKIGKMRYILPLIIAIGGTTASFAKELQVVLYGQATPVTCWAAMSRMVLKAYGVTKSEQDLLNYATGGKAAENCFYGSASCCDGVLTQYGSIKTSGFALYSTFTDVKVELNKGHPIMIRSSRANLAHHNTLIIGYKTNPDMLIINDPDPMPNGLRREVLYSSVVQDPNNVAIRWMNTLKLMSDPAVPIPDSVNPPPTEWMMVESNGTFSITPSTTSLTYYASRSFTTSATWTMKLSFPYNGGDCIARTYTANGNTKSRLTWNITGFSMPTGYKWLYCFDGKVPGRIEATINYNGKTLSHAKNVLFVPSQLYPGCVWYGNKTISTSLSDVKAHQEIILQNDVFNSGTNIDFKSGGAININDGVTINNGSSTDFSVDPAFW